MSERAMDIVVAALVVGLIAGCMAFIWICA